MPDSSITVTLSSKLAPIFTVVGAAVGFALSFLVGPVVAWMLERLDSAPAPLRLVDQLPLIWAAPLLTLVGAVVGWIIFAVWNEEVGRILVDDQKIRIETKRTSADYSRDEVAQIFLDKDELVLTDEASQELSRTSSDSGLAESLSQAFTTFGYPWAGIGDPLETEFTEWVDRSQNLNEVAHARLRARRRALTDDKAGEAESLREELVAQGIVVRDRGEKQQYRLISTR